MERSYPTTEHFDQPTDEYQVMASELRLYPDGQSFRNALVGLNRQYGKTAFALSMQAHVKRTSASLRYAEQSSPDSADYLFYSGTIFGLHSSVYLLPKQARQQVLGSFIVAQPPGGLRENESAVSFACRTALYYVERFEEIDGLFDELAPTNQDILMQAAERAGKGVDQDNELNFMRGAVFASNWASILAQNH